MKLGRKPRGHDPRIPKLADLRKAIDELSPLPPVVNYSVGMPGNLGVMLNDSLGDCTCAAVGHAIQVWTANTGGMVTPPDSAILSLYELAGGYVPGDPDTDEGCVEQTVLTDWLTNPVAGNELAAFVEIDVGDLATVKRSIWEAGLVYIGFAVPAYLMDSLMAPGSVWDVNPAADNTIVGGHAVILVGYDAQGNMTVISWGNWYTMTPAFWAAFVDEAYMLANADWLEKTGNTPAGLNLAQLESLMQALQYAPSTGARRQHRRRKRARQREQA